MAFEGLANIKGLEFLNNINLSGFFKGAGNLFLLLFVVLIVGGIVMYLFWWKKNNALYSQKIHFFEEVNKQLVPIEDCMAAELTIPNTNIRIFYIKSKDLYMPRGTKKMGNKSYWYAIRNNREIINFTISNINEDLKKANLDFDHTDMRYAYTNLREIIKRNYKDKSAKWWKEYKDVISMVIYVFVFTLSFYFLISKIGSIMGGLAEVTEKVATLVENMANLQGGSASGIKAA